MKTIKVDNCRYCRACTTIDVPDDYLDRVEEFVENGDIGCFNCNDDGDNHSGFDIYEDYKKVWCGHTTKCRDMEI